MSVWNVVDGDAFTLQTLTAKINSLAFTPTMIAKMGIFSEKGVATLSALVEEIDEAISLLGPKPRGAPGHVVVADKRKLHSLTIPHIPQRAAIMADSVQGVRMFGTENNTQTIESERDARLMKMRKQIDQAIEYHRLLALKGSYMDVNGDTQSAYTLLGGSRDSVDFLLGTSTTKLDQKCLDVIGNVEDGLGGSSYTKIHAICSLSFWSKLISHAVVKDTYKFVNGLSAAAKPDQNDPLTGSFEFGEIVWHRYRGNSSVAVDDGKAYAFPVGVGDEIYMSRFAPAPYNETVNTIGLPYYSKAKEMDFGVGIDLQAQSNPLNICLRPTALVEVTTSN
jgi:hypothetical protein